MNSQPVLETIDPEIVEHLVERKQDIDHGSSAPSALTAALSLGSIPIALAALSRNVYAQGGLPAGIKNVLDFALALEIFENEFYKAVLGTSASHAQNSAFAPVRAIALGFPAAINTLLQIQKHEDAHVATLMATGATNVFGLDANSFDFTGARGAGDGPFSEATTDLAFLLEVAQGAEDTGVRAYKGQAGNLISNSAILEAALRIHSVEARHASRIRRIRRIAAGAPSIVRYSGTVRGGEREAAGGTTPGTVNPAAVGAAFDRIYGAGSNSTTAPSESNTFQLGIDVSNLAGAPFGIEAATEAFDEPLDRADVVAIVQPFFIPTVS